MNTLSFMEIIGIDVSRPGWSAFSDNITASTGRQVIIFGFGCVLISWRTSSAWNGERPELPPPPDTAKFRRIPLIERPSRKWACKICCLARTQHPPPRSTKSILTSTIYFAKHLFLRVSA